MTAPGLPAATPQFHRRLEQAIAEARDPAAAYGGDWRIEPDERIGAPVRGRRGKLVRRGLLVAALLVGAATHHLDPSLLPRVWVAVAATAAPLVEQAWRQVNPPPAAPPAPGPTLARLLAPGGPVPETAPRAVAAEGPAAPPAIAPVSTPLTAAAGSAAAPVSESQHSPKPSLGSAETAPLAERTPPEAGPPPAVSNAPPYAPPPPATDPLQKLAEAAGLHPGLSRTLLARLTQADWRNAAAAVDTAVAETPDGGEHVWPRRRDGGLALFRVHFVAGAGAGCRRYVVTIAKDGWLTTALPMERCGVRSRQAERR